MAGQAPRFPFVATERAQALKWQKECRDALGKTLGFVDDPPVASDPVVVEEHDRGDFLSRKVVITTAPSVQMPMYLLSPKNVDHKLPVVIAYHGHGYGVADIVGRWENGDLRCEPDGYHKDFAVALCRKGFLVAAPEISCFGERQQNYSSFEMGEPVPTTCHNVATFAIMLGKSVLGMRVRDGMRLVDYLTTLPTADVSRLGMMGISGGGMLTFFHTALDHRIKASVISGYYSSFRDSTLAMNHCTCNFVPGLLSIGEMSDLVGLILPRPMLVEAGTRDPIFPVTAVRHSVGRAREICKTLGGNAGDVEYDEFEGRHQVSGRRSYQFLVENLGELS